MGLVEGQVHCGLIWLEDPLARAEIRGWPDGPGKRPALYSNTKCEPCFSRVPLSLDAPRRGKKKWRKQILVKGEELSSHCMNCSSGVIHSGRQSLASTEGSLVRSGSKQRGIFLPLPPQHWACKCTLQGPAFLWVLEIEPKTREHLSSSPNTFRKLWVETQCSLCVARAWLTWGSRGSSHRVIVLSST